MVTEKDFYAILEDDDAREGVVERNSKECYELAKKMAIGFGQFVAKEYEWTGFGVWQNLKTLQLFSSQQLFELYLKSNK